MRYFFALTLALTLACAAPTYAGPLYSVDDGSSENALGLTVGGDLIWLNKFKVDPANNLIVDIQVMFGATAVIPNGTAFTLAIWKDTDGKVADAMLQATAKGVVANSGKEVFNTYTIPATLATRAFYGGLIMTHLAGQFPTSFD